jgi:RNA polymerase sigma-70 factor (ECF subfamily)
MTDRLDHGSSRAAQARDAVSAAFHAEWGRVVATLIRGTGNWDLAEECAQEAFAQAVRRWAVDGVPDRPGAWLTTVARNCAIDRIRRRTREAEKLEELAQVTPSNDELLYSVEEIPDERLRLMFTCCHPALCLEARVALTLRTLAGLSTAEIGAALLVSEQTMAKRLVRAKQKIRNAAIPYRVPPAHLLPDRLSGVLAVLYLLFNEGYFATTGASVTRRALTDEAIRLARLLVALMPDEPEARGLLALMLLQDSRRDARVDASGDVVLLEDQDRSRWDRSRIVEGLAELQTALRRDRLAPYQLQAAIAASHAVADRPTDTDWARIALLYGQLEALTPSPVVALNRAVAVAMADGPAAGLPLLDELDRSGALAGYHLLAAARADLLRRLGRTAEAAEAYRQAVDLATHEAERRFLTRRLSDL